MWWCRNEEERQREEERLSEISELMMKAYSDRLAFEKERRASGWKPSLLDKTQNNILCKDVYQNELENLSEKEMRIIIPEGTTTILKNGHAFSSTKNMTLSEHLTAFPNRSLIDKIWIS